MSKKFLTAVVAAGVLWIVVLGQVFCTRIWVEKKGLTQAFTGNNMVVMQETKQDLYGNEYIEGTCQGKLSSGEAKNLAQKMMQQLGGTVLMDSKGIWEKDAFVAYGYTNGIKKARKIDGTWLNLTVSFRYNAEKDQTRILFGSPLINVDF